MLNTDMVLRLMEYQSQLIKSVNTVTENGIGSQLADTTGHTKGEHKKHTRLTQTHTKNTNTHNTYPQACRKASTQHTQDTQIYKLTHEQTLGMLGRDGVTPGAILLETTTGESQHGPDTTGFAD